MHNVKIFSHWRSSQVLFALHGKSAQQVTRLTGPVVHRGDIDGEIIHPNYD